MDGMVDAGAYLTLGDNNEVKIIEGTPVIPTRYRNIYGTLNAKKPEIPKVQEIHEVQDNPKTM